MFFYTGKPRGDRSRDKAVGDEEANESAQQTPIAESDESSDLDEIDPDDERWDAFIADDDERDPQPDYGDFWFDGSAD